MANTIRTFTGDGVRTLYPVNFDLGYARREFVYVYTGTLDNYEDQLDYTWVNDSEITLSEPIPSGEELYIRRIVPRNQAFNDYNNGAILKEDNLDDSFAQALMIWEELSDGIYDPDGDTQVNASLDMNGNTITNVAVDESDGSSAITVTYADGKYVNLLGDTMLAPLGGVNAASNEHFMPRQQVVATIDARMETAPEFDPDDFIDYGLVTESVQDQLDYGSI